MISREKAMGSIHNSLPQDILFKIISLLPVRDVCSLASCSKSWRELCGSDPIWVYLSKQRWPLLNVCREVSGRWKDFHKNKHYEIAARISEVIKFVEQCSSSNSLEVRDYLKAIEDLCSMQLDYKDVELFLFKQEQNVLLNVIGLHYCISWLGVSVSYTPCAKGLQIPWKSVPLTIRSMGTTISKGDIKSIKYWEAHIYGNAPILFQIISPCSNDIDMFDQLEGNGAPKGTSNGSKLITLISFSVFWLLQRALLKSNGLTWCLTT